VERLFKESDVGVLLENFNDNIKILKEYLFIKKDSK